MQIRKLTAKDQLQYRDLCRHAFGMTAKQAADYVVAGPEYDRAFGVFEGSKLAAGLWYYPYKMRIGLEYLPMAGVAAVATWPEYRNRGLAKKLMVHAQEYMKKDGCPTSALMPFKFSFYERMGYAHAFDMLICEFDPGKIKDFPPEGYNIREVDGAKSWKRLEKIHLGFGQKYNGTVHREATYWKKKCLVHPKRVYRSYIVYRRRTPCGYVLTAVEEPFEYSKADIYIYWLGWTEPGAARAIFTFFKSHRDQFKKIKMFLPPDVPIHQYFADPRIEVKLEPKMMFKLVDVAAALRQRSYPGMSGGEIEIDVQEDSTAPWNTGRYRITFEREKAHVTKLQRGRRTKSTVTTSVPALSQLFLGYYSADELFQMNAIAGPANAREVLARAFPKSPVYIEDWF